MALNLIPNLTGGRRLQTNLRAIERHLNDDHYVRRFAPGDFILGGAGVPGFLPIPAATPRWPSINMPPLLTSYGIVDWDKPSEWRSGKLKVRYWYTSPIGNVANFAIQISIDAARDTEVLPATNLYTVTTNVAGPAVANTVIRSADFYTTTSLGSDDELFSLRILRAAPDANPNDFHLLYVRVEHIPALEEAD